MVLKSTLHTLRFTPGTEFMHKLKDALILFAARYLHSSKLVKVIVSGSDREGEGEYKLFEYLHNLPLHEGYNFDSKHKNRCLVFGKYVTKNISKPNLFFSLFFISLVLFS